MTVLLDVVRSGIPPRTTSAGFSSSSELRSLSSSPPSLSGKRSSTSFWYQFQFNFVNFTKSHPFSKCFSPTLLTIVSRWIRALSFKVNCRQSSNEETNNSISQKEFSSLSVTSATVNFQIRCRSFLTLVAIVCWSLPVCGSHVAGSNPCRLLEFTPNRAS